MDISGATFESQGVRLSESDDTGNRGVHEHQAAREQTDTFPRLSSNFITTLGMPGDLDS
jgi:hypothetical protein